jgi:hypothetical protein
MQKSSCAVFFLALLASIPASAGIARNPQTGVSGLETTNYFASANAIVAPSANVTLADSAAAVVAANETAAAVSPASAATVGTSFNASPAVTASTPEPATLSLAFLSLCALGFARKRRTNA